MSEILFEQFRFLSADQRTEIAAYIWREDTATPRGILQLVHGMCEYSMRYDALARHFARQGYIVCGHDHLGHGQTAPDASALGYTAKRGGADLLVEDAHTMTVQMRERYPELPIFLYGHSMGSFVARLYLSRYGEELAGALISGTAGPGQPTGLGLKLTHAIAAAKGAHHRSRLLTSIAFGSYNKKFKGEQDPHSWLTRDARVREAYKKDPLCCFVFTTAGYDTLFSLLSAVSDKKWAYTVPRELPLFLFAGEMDPVGNYGKGVKAVHQRLLDAGCNTRLKLYPEARHEPHNDVCAEELFADIAKFLEESLA